MKMKRVLLAIILTLTSVSLFAQVRKTTSWTFDASKVEVNTGDEIDLIFKVTVINDWYIYSSDLDPDVGPIPTEVRFEENGSFEVIGALIPTKPKKKHDEVWGADKMLKFISNLKPLELIDWNMLVVGVLKLLLLFRTSDIRALRWKRVYMSGIKNEVRNQ